MIRMAPLLLLFVWCVQVRAHPQTPAGASLVPVGPAVEEPLAAMAVDADDPDHLLLATAYGEAWHTTDGGIRWRRVLEAQGAVSDDAWWHPLDMSDAGLLDIDPGPAEFADDPAVWDEPDEDLALEGQGALPHGEVAASWEAEGAARLGRVVVAIAGGRLAIGREDGVYVSTDEGRHWRVLPDLHDATALSWTSSALLVGRADGLWRVQTSAQGLVERMARVDVQGIAVDGEVVLLAGAAGLVRLRPGAEPRLLHDEPMTGVVAASGGAWAFGPRGLVRVEDQRVTRHPAPRGMVSFAVANGRFVAVATGGLWHSDDLQGSWLQAGRYRVDGVTGGAGVLFAHGADGAWRIEEDHRKTAPWADAPSLAASIEAAGGARLGRMRPLRLRLGPLLPDVNLEAVYHVREIEWYVPESGSRGRSSQDWRVGLRLGWTPGRHASDDGLHGFGGGGPQSLELHGAWNRLGRREFVRRTRAVDRVVALHVKRDEWLNRLGALPADLLLERCLAMIHIAEIDARMDLVTGGTVRRTHAEP